MEIVLQWIDDLDDLAHAAAFILVRMRRLCLQIGLGAALILQLVATRPGDGSYAFYLAGAASASVATWGLALLADRFVHSRNGRTRLPA